MKFLVENADQNRSMVLNQAIALIISFRSKEGALYLKNGGRAELDFIYKSRNDVEKDGEKTEAIEEWLSYLQDLLKKEGFETIIYDEEDDGHNRSKVLSFVDVNNKKTKGIKKGGKK